MTISSQAARRTAKKFGMQTGVVPVQDHWGSFVDRGHRWKENEHRKTAYTFAAVAQRPLLFAAIYRLGPLPTLSH